MIRRILGRAFVTALVVGAATIAQACPFCSAVQMTFTEEVDASDMAVFAELIEPPADTGELDTLDPVAAAEAAQAKFRVIEVLKGSEHVKPGDVIQSMYFGDKPVGSEFLVMGVEPEQTQWSTPIEMSPRVKDYVKKMLALPREDNVRLLTAVNFLEDEEEPLRRDAYDEFAKTPYDRVKQLRGKLDHDLLVEWITDIETPASRQRLYFTLLGVNGSEADLPMLEKMITSDDKQRKAGLDSMIACYLQLGGPERLTLIEDTFLRNRDAEFTDTYSALMALRFHGQETDVIPREQLVKSFRLMLDRPKLADLVIPDLARWEDWEAIPLMVELFKKSDKSTSWVRVPVVNFLRACPLPEAAEQLEELAKIDPDAVKRASTFFPFSGAGAQRSDKQKQATEEASPTEEATADTATDTAAATDGEPADLPPAPEDAADPAPSEDAAAAPAVIEDATPADVVASESAAPINRVWFVVTPIVAVLLLLGAYVIILGLPSAGARRPASPARQD